MTLIRWLWTFPNNMPFIPLNPFLSRTEKCPKSFSNVIWKNYSVPFLFAWYTPIHAVYFYKISFCYLEAQFSFPYLLFFIAKMLVCFAALQISSLTFSNNAFVVAAVIFIQILHFYSPKATNLKFGCGL